MLGQGKGSEGRSPDSCAGQPFSFHQFCKENSTGKGPKVDCSGSRAISGLQKMRIDISLISPRNISLRKRLSDTVKERGRGWSFGSLHRPTVQLSSFFLQVVHCKLHCEQGQARTFSWGLTRPSCQGM